MEKRDECMESESDNEPDQPEQIKKEMQNVKEEEFLALKASLKFFKKLMTANQTLLYKEMLKDVCDLYKVDTGKFLMLVNFGESYFKVD